MTRFALRSLGALVCALLAGCSASPSDPDQTEDGGSGKGGSGGASTSGAGGSSAGSPGGGSSSGGALAGSGGSGTGGATNGGTASAGGSGGANDGGSGGVHIVAACDSLGSVGTWENVEPAEFHSPSNMQTVALAVNPADQSVYAAASNKTNGGDGSTGIYKSTDCGATWEMINTGQGKEALATGQLWAMLIDPSAPENIYVANGYGNGNSVYKSTNGGVDFESLQTDPAGKVGFVQAIALEAGNSQHVAVTYHDNCQAPRRSNCMSQSTDGGGTWEQFDGPAQVSGWREAASLTILGPSSYLYTCDAGVFFTSDGGSNWSEAIDDGVFGRYAGSAYLAADGALYLGTGNSGIYWSRADLEAEPAVPLGKSWTQIPGTPQPIANIIGTENQLIAAHINGPPFFSADLSAPTTWTQMASEGVTSGSNEMAYDAAHHVVYSANFQSGLLRLVTE